MKLLGLGLSVSSLGFALLLPACSGSSDESSTSGTMFIETCSLGCSSGAGGNQVNCSIIQAFLNQEIAVTFSESVAASSVNSQTFQLIDEISGLVPTGTRFVDPSDPRKVIFRPAIFFDDDGTPSFGFTPNTTYRVTIPGTEQNDPGPFIRSLGGKPNKSKMQCDILTGTSLVDPVPGDPTVQVFVDQSIIATPDPDDVIPNVPAHLATDVSLQSKITFVFNDLMNPSTLANPITHQPTFVTIKVDADGNPATPLDQQPLFGEYLVDLDFDLLKTTMVFTSPIGIPSGGDPSLHPVPRKIVIELPTNIQDLAFNSLANPGLIVFTPEIIDLPPATLPDSDGENFDGTANLDEAESGALWGDGRLTRGYGGGSGRLGLLQVETGEVVTLNTDSQEFPLAGNQSGLPDILNNYTGTIGELDPAPTVTVTDGQFEFSSIVVETGGTLRLTGSQPGRLFSRGPAVIFGNGSIDVRGGTPLTHPSNNAAGQTGAPGGPSGGAGGQGADRPDHGGSNLEGAIGGIDHGDDNLPTTPGFSIDGRPGVGVGGTGTLAFGPGGAHYPNPFPTTTTVIGGLETTAFVDPPACIAKQVAGPGGGGAYSTSGAAGSPMSNSPTTWSGASTTPGPTPGGDSNAVGLEPPDPENNHFIRKLPFELQFLRGGAGGGGGGANLFDTRSAGSAIVPTPCSDEVSGAGISQVAGSYRDHSAAGGGGGGGAVQLVSGATLSVSGQILAGGGAGGSAELIDPGTSPPQRTMRASPGGGGSGGAIKLQGLVVAVETTPGSAHIFIDGGLGGTNTLGATGGKGGVGLVRIEDTTGQLSRASESPKINPFDPLHVNPATGLVESEQWVSVAFWERPRRRPESFSGAVSCWMRPAGSFFQLEFIEDDPLNPNAELQFGWNMDVIYQDDDDPAETLIKYRGPDPNSPFVDDFETVIGNQLNHGLAVGQGSYFAVRFQGAIANGPMTDPCNVELPDEIAPGSLTPWVKHPAELNDFNPRPNMVRFTVVFDFALATAHSVPSFVKGVTNLKIRTQPD